MSGDCQSQGLADWLQALGWSQRLKPSDLQKLNTPKMRSIWRHLQAHVVPTHKASVIRKNVLLARLEQENISLGQFRNFTLDSVNQLQKMKEILKIEAEKDKINEEIKIVDEKVHDQKSNLLENISLEQWQRQKLSETETKTMILELKNVKLVKDIKKVNYSKDTIVHLKCSKTPNSLNELNQKKSLVSKYVKNYVHPLKDNEDDSEYLSEMISAILGFKPDPILDGITQNAKEALRSLNSKVDSSAIMGNISSSKNTVSFQSKLRDLKIEVIRNELKICECHEKIALEQEELRKEKFQLVEASTKKYGDSCNLKRTPQVGDLEMESKEDCYKQTREVMDGLENLESCNINKTLNCVLEKIEQERKNNIIQVEQNRLMATETELEALEDIEQTVTSLIAKEAELCVEVEKKVNEVNMVASAVYRSFVDSGEANEILAEISQMATDFKTETSQTCKNNIDSIKFTEMVLKEIEVFQRTRIVALQRMWDSSNNVMPVCLSQKSSHHPLLLSFLLQTEEKNSIVNVLVKYLWSLSINPQFH